MDWLLMLLSFFSHEKRTNTMEITAINFSFIPFNILN